MKIQKGIVKYKDRNDIVCTYGVADGGKQFYFLDETDVKKFANGNRIASTELVEAIDPMVKASHIGIVSSNGQEVIPFIYKSIRPVNDSIVLVELSKPTSPSVLEAISLKSDPLSAAKLVSTPAAIKEKINAKMGADGRYLFNDQFSEVTVCDIDGNNLVENQLYSFAGLSNGKLYLSKNTIDSEIVEFSVLPPEEQVTESNEINVTEVNVDKNIIDNAMAEASGSMVSDIPPIVAEDTVEEDSTVSDSIDTISEEMPSVEADSESEVEAVTSVVEDENVVSDEIVEPVTSDALPVEENISNEDIVPNDNISDNVQIVPDDIVPVVDSSESDVVAENVVSDETVETDKNIDDSISDDIKADVSVTNTEANDIVDEGSLEDDLEDFTTSDDDDDSELTISFTEPTTSSLPSVEDSLSNTSVESSIPDLDLRESNDDVSIDISNDDINSDDNIYTSENGSSLIGDDAFNDDIFKSDDYKIDKIENDDYYNEDFEQSYSSPKVNVGGDSIMNDVAKSLASLMKQNRSQKTIIAEYKDKVDKLSASRRNIVEKAKIQEQKLEALNNRNRNFENTITKLEAKLQMLEGRIRDQDKLIAYQSKELESIKPQKDDLAKLVADAQALLGDEDNGVY